MTTHTITQHVHSKCTYSQPMRLVLENAKSDRIALKKETETLQLHMEMEVMRFKEKLRYEINMADNVDVDYIEIPPMPKNVYIRTSSAYTN